MSPRSLEIVEDERLQVPYDTRLAQETLRLREIVAELQARVRENEAMRTEHVRNELFRHYFRRFVRRERDKAHLRSSMNEAEAKQLIHGLKPLFRALIALVTISLVLFAFFVAVLAANGFVPTSNACVNSKVFCAQSRIAACEKPHSTVLAIEGGANEVWYNASRHEPPYAKDWPNKKNNDWAEAMMLSVLVLMMISTTIQCGLIIYVRLGKKINQDTILSFVLIVAILCITVLVAYVILIATLVRGD